MGNKQHIKWWYRISLWMCKYFNCMNGMKSAKRMMSRKEFGYLCHAFTKIYRDSNCPEEYIVGFSVRTLFILYGLYTTLSEKISTQCCVAAQSGWKDADKILDIMAKKGGAWSEDFFDANSTSLYMSLIQVKEGISSTYNIELIRWSYRYGERLRVHYHTIPEFIETFEKGNLYDIDIEIIEEGINVNSTNG